MNKERRKELGHAIEKLDGIRAALTQAKEDLEEVKGDIEGLKDDETEYYENMPEAFQQGEKGEVAQAAISEMDEAISSIESAVDNISNAQA